DDAAGWAAATSAASPFLVCSEQGIRHEMVHHPTTMARWVADLGGEILGVARVRPGDGPRELRVVVQVHPDHQGRGVGSGLFARVLDLAEGAALRGIVNGDTHSGEVARRWQVALQREFMISSVDPGRVAAPLGTPGGVVVVPLTVAGLEAVWACHEAAASGDPSGLTRSIPLEEFAATQWRDPDHRGDLGRAVMADRTVLAYTSVTATGDRAWNSMTGTLPDQRGRGLATLAKRHCCAALAAAGVTRCWAGNDGANGPMLAVNHALGYRRTISTWGAHRAAS
ncbi:MAG: GNAT family N-acetyltransferase, partial [Nocardioides sp.]|nr:GNAT family N-acetyltransferase [Nocardioides sp.]